MSVIKKIILITLILLVSLIFTAGIKNSIGLDDVQFCIKHFGCLAPIIFIAIYSIAPTFFIPITPLSVTAGVLFGPVLGTLYTTIGSTIGGCIAFLVSRHILKDWVDKKTPARVSIFKEKFQKEGWKFIAISRITPVFPFNVQNYIFGLTEIDLKTFFLVSLFSLIPGSFVYVYLGFAGKSLFKDEKNMVINAAIAVFVFMLFLFLPQIIKQISKQFAKNEN
jgi:uncharacterized membrane protein YdjX (TVP38/TMEM64 family)